MTTPLPYRRPRQLALFCVGCKGKGYVVYFNWQGGLTRVQCPLCKSKNNSK